MSFLPAMLITTAIIGGTGSLSAGINSADMNALQNISNKNPIRGQVIVGNSSNLESVLNGLGIDMDSLKDCIKPSLPQNPDNSIPESKPEAPDTDKPGNDTESPETPEIPDIDKPGNDTESPETPEIPDADKPGNDTPETPEIPDTDKPGNDSQTPGTGNPDDNSSGSDQDTDSSYAKQVVVLVNAERAKAGLPALTMMEDLNAAALIRAKETTQSFSHTRPNGSSFSSVLNENGISYRGAGENIAWGQQTPEIVVNGWMNSEGHRANILNKNFTSIGVGYYLNNSTPYWAQLFTY